VRGRRWVGGFRLGWPRLGPGASAGPDGVQHHTEPQKSQHHELIVKKVWNHSIAPSPWDDMGALYRVFGAGQLSAGYRYTTWYLGCRHLRSDVIGDDPLEMWACNTHSAPYFLGLEGIFESLPSANPALVLETPYRENLAHYPLWPLRPSGMFLGQPEHNWRVYAPRRSVPSCTTGRPAMSLSVSSRHHGGGAAPDPPAFLSPARIP
jgi:hypothetical protein